MIISLKFYQLSSIEIMNNHKFKYLKKFPNSAYQNTTTDYNKHRKSLIQQNNFIYDEYFFRNSTTFKSFEEKMAGAYTNVKVRKHTHSLHICESWEPELITNNFDFSVSANHHK